MMQVPHEYQSRYLERRKNDLHKCLKDFETRNFLDLEKVGHQLKGSALTFGHPDLASIGEKLEEGAFCRNTLVIKQALEEFKIWISRRRIN